MIHLFICVSQVHLAFGGAGGSTIISGVAQIAMRTLFMGWNIKEVSFESFLAMNTHIHIYDQKKNNINKYSYYIYYIFLLHFNSRQWIGLVSTIN